MVTEREKGEVKEEGKQGRGKKASSRIKEKIKKKRGRKVKVRDLREGGNVERKECEIMRCGKLEGWERKENNDTAENKGREGKY